MSYIPKDEDWADAPPRWEYPLAAAAFGVLWIAAIALAVLA